MDFQFSDLVTYLKTQGIGLLRGILILVIGFFLIHWVTKLVKRSDRMSRIEPTIRGFLENLIRLLMYVVVILTAANVIGIPMTSLLTLVASAGVAISLAMQGALSNLVGGMMLLILKPIKVDEYIKAGEIEGTVKRISAFYTELSMPDNRFVNVPNSSLTNTAIINFTRQGTRRMDIAFSVGYGSDLALVKRVLMDVVNANPAVLRDPEPVVRLTECGDSALKMTIRAWANNADYWDVNFYLLEEGKLALDRAGVEIPYPQVDVHMKS